MATTPSAHAVESLTPTVARPAPRRHLSMFSNSITLIGSKVAAMGLGFLFWVLAARLFSQEQVGLAAGVVSAMMLCTQFALLGLGNAVIARFPRHQDRPAALLDTAFTLVAVAAVAGGGLFLLLASGLFTELDAVAHDLSYALLFLAAALFGTIGILLDQVSTTLRRGDHALLRGLAFGIAAVGSLGLLAALTDAHSAQTLLLPWVLAGACAWLIGMAQLRRTLEGYRLRPRIQGAIARELVSSGLPNYALTLSQRAPGLILPVVVVELLSPEANATWYVAWMMAWIVYIVAIQVELTTFAEVAHDPDSLRQSIRRGVRASLGIGVPAALVLAIAAHPLLSILGPEYADAGVTPLRILVLAIVPLTFVQIYYAACRGVGRLSEAIVAGWVTGALSIGAAAAAGAAEGLTAMALSWLSVQVLAGIWAWWRMRRVRTGLGAPAQSS
jgi:O-antigen/teichoic acid export membrane protein